MLPAPFRPRPPPLAPPLPTSTPGKPVGRATKPAVGAVTAPPAQFQQPRRPAPAVAPVTAVSHVTTFTLHLPGTVVDRYLPNLLQTHFRVIPAAEGDYRAEFSDRIATAVVLVFAESDLQLDCLRKLAVQAVGRHPQCAVVILLESVAGMSLQVRFQQLRDPLGCFVSGASAFELTGDTTVTGCVGTSWGTFRSAT